MDTAASKWLREELDRQKMTVPELAGAMKSPPATVYRILNENRGVGKRVANKLADALKLDRDFVLYKVGISNRDPKSPREKLDPYALDFVALIENRPDDQKQAILATVRAMAAGFDRGLRGQDHGGNT